MSSLSLWDGNCHKSEIWIRGKFQIWMALIDTCTINSEPDILASDTLGGLIKAVLMSKHLMSGRYWTNAGQHWPNIGLTLLVCLVIDDYFQLSIVCTCIFAVCPLDALILSVALTPPPLLHRFAVLALHFCCCYCAPTIPSVLAGLSTMN